MRPTTPKKRNEPNLPHPHHPPTQKYETNPISARQKNETNPICSTTKCPAVPYFSETNPITRTGTASPVRARHAVPLPPPSRQHPPNMRNEPNLNPAKARNEPNHPYGRGITRTGTACRAPTATVSPAPPKYAKRTLSQPGKSAKRTQSQPGKSAKRTQSPVRARHHPYGHGMPCPYRHRLASTPQICETNPIHVPPSSRRPCSTLLRKTNPIYPPATSTPPPFMQNEPNHQPIDANCLLQKDLC